MGISDTLSMGDKLTLRGSFVIPLASMGKWEKRLRLKKKKELPFTLQKPCYAAAL